MIRLQSCPDIKIQLLKLDPNIYQDLAAIWEGEEPTTLNPWLHISVPGKCLILPAQSFKMGTLVFFELLF